MKKLFVFPTNSGDGSYSIYATFDEKLINKMKKMYDNDELNTKRFGDGDGFHYQTWNLPDECTVKSVGFNEIKEKDLNY